MGPTELLQELDKRYYTCRSGYRWNGYECVRNSGWFLWGRWVVTGILIFVFVLALCVFSRVKARRRRTQGQPPMYGTGWMAPGKYENNPNAYQAPPPQYSSPGYNNDQQPQYGQQQQYTGQTYNSNEGYYGSAGQTEGVAPPQNTYYPQQGARGGDNVYAPPPGPPPGK